MRYIQVGLKRYQCAILKNTTLAIGLPICDTVSPILVSQYIFVTSFNYQVWHHHNAVVIFFSVTFTFLSKVFFFFFDTVFLLQYEQQSNIMGIAK